jgi:uncharacterized protein (TIGR02001 family)
MQLDFCKFLYSLYIREEKRMKKIISIAMALSFYLMTPAASAEEAGGPLAKDNFSANIAYTTDYLFRGISLSNDNAAVSGGFDWGYNGFYIGTWASSISPVEDETVEIDFYGGYAGEFSGISYSVDVIYYGYPGEADNGTDLDYVEFGGSLGYTFETTYAPTIGFSVMHSTDFFGESGDATAYQGTFGVSLPMDIALDFHYGHQDLDAAFNGISGYDYYGVNLSKSLGIFDFTVGYSDTDGDGETFEGDSTDTVVFTVGSSF